VFALRPRPATPRAASPAARPPPPQRAVCVARGRGRGWGWFRTTNVIGAAMYGAGLPCPLLRLCASRPAYAIPPPSPCDVRVALGEGLGVGVASPQPAMPALTRPPLYCDHHVTMPQ
jgi:hypothetical protein